MSCNLAAMRALGLMPLLFFCAVAVYVRHVRSGVNAALPWRDATIVSGIGTGVWVVAGCEVLGLFRAVAFWPLLIWWGVPIAVLGWKCRLWRPHVPELPKDRLLMAIVCATLLVLTLVFIQAAMTPPNNWDALSYHLPRQIYWMQQGQVGFFPTNDSRMVLMQPLAEYAGLHLMILSGGDHWVNLVQWFALGLTALTASAIARELGCGARLQATAALLVVTIPAAALEAANPKNDVVAAFYLCAFAFAGLRAYRLAGKEDTLISVTLVGAACGLLLLSKGTGMIFGLPVALWIGSAYVRVAGLKRALVWGGGVSLIVFAINAGFLIRMTAAFGSPLGPPVGEGAPGVRNTLFTPAAFVSNFVRNTAMHLASGAERIDDATTTAVTALHNWIGLDVNDPRTTFKRGARFSVKPSLADEDRAKAPVHMALGIVTFVIALVGFFRAGDKWLAVFDLLPFLCFALFSSLTAWQEWHSRLHIPAICLAAPVIVRALRQATFPFAGLALAIVLVSIVSNEAKPLFELRNARERFKNESVRSGLEHAQVAVRERRPKVLGIIAEKNRCEYFLLSALLKAQDPPPVFLKMNSIFEKFESPRTNYDLVISWHSPPGVTNADFQARYALLSEAGAVKVFGRK